MIRTSPFIYVIEGFLLLLLLFVRFGSFGCFVPLRYGHNALILMMMPSLLLIYLFGFFFFERFLFWLSGGLSSSFVTKLVTTFDVSCWKKSMDWLNAKLISLIAWRRSCFFRHRSSSHIIIFVFLSKQTRQDELRTCLSRKKAFY